MASRWPLVEDLVEDSAAMQARRSSWLPKEKQEEQQDYDNRVLRSILFGAYRDTLTTLAGKPFSREVVLTGDELPEKLAGIPNNVDMTGRGLSDFLKSALWGGMQYGLVHGLCDFPENPNRGMGPDPPHLRPRFVLYRAPQVLGWRTETIDGVPILSQVRLRETKTINVGDFGEEEVQQIRVYERDRWRLYEKRKGDKDYQPIDDWKAHSFGSVPLVTLYMNRTGLMEGSPPLYDLAELNLAHFRSNSQQTNIVHFIRCGILMAAGFDKDTLKSIVVSPKTFVKTNKDAREVELKYVEHTGRAVEAGRQELAALKEEMQVLGLKPLIERAVGGTATAHVYHESRHPSAIQSWVLALQSWAQMLFELAGRWAKAEVPADFKVDVFNDFGLSAKDRQDAEVLLKMSQPGEDGSPPKITHATFLQEMKRRGILGENVNVDQEVEDVNQEAGDSLLRLIRSTRPEGTGEPETRPSSLPPSGSETEAEPAQAAASGA
jgi:hypothetical protein